MTDLNSDPTTNPLASRRFLPWLLVLFVGSGCAALIYEVVWLQLLQLVIGSSGISMGVLLGTFMGGMCLGSYLLPRLISSRHHPLRVYAFLELGIGIIGTLVLFVMPFIADAYTGFLGHGVVARALVATVCLIPPTLLMGATLPAIARWVETTPEGVSWMGLFYGGNIGGAVLGCLLAGFFLLRLYDMPTATYVAVCINASVAAIALLMASRTPGQVKSAAQTPMPSESRTSTKAVYITIGMSGLCALGAEVIWTRLLSLMLGATVYTFSIILAVFLVGLGIGSSAGAFAARSARRPRVVLGICQMMLAGAVAWAAIMIANSLPYWPINPIKTTSLWGPWYTFSLDLLRAACAVLPAALLWGASFPLALAAVASPGRDGGKMVGGVYASNTIGAILGSLFFSMLVIPQIGTQWAQRILIILSAASALVALAPLFFSSRGRADSPEEPTSMRPLSGSRWVVGTVVSLVIAGVLAAFVSPMPWVAVAFGRFSATWLEQIAPQMVKDEEVPLGAPDSTFRYCTYVGEGTNVSVAITKSTAGWRYFHGAGKVQASTDPQDMRLQRMLGHLSVLARSDPDDVKDVLVVALGAGVTAGSFVPYPKIERITICDIEPLVPKVVAPIFGNENYHIVDGIDKENPRKLDGKEIRMVYDDGRHYIRTLPKDAKFDIITSDPIDPWVKGCAALNTIEYYQMCKEHLKPGGVMSLWIPLYESNNDSAKSLIATFFQVFPNGMLFSNDLNNIGYDAVLLGQVEPARIDLDKLEERLGGYEYARVKQSLLDVGFGANATNINWAPNAVGDSIMSLLATYAGRGVDLGEWTRGAQLNTDRNLRLQYLAGMSVNSYMETEILKGILKNFRFPDDVFEGSTTNVEALKSAFKAAKRMP
jgi:spermidine synthase